ncbi:MAG TPA: cellulose synthase [Ramlibacter sp.]|nr:cellulose synthase [Ramlibacter sp.]
MHTVPCWRWIALCMAAAPALAQQPVPSAVVQQPAPAAAAVSVADVFRKFNGDTSISRSVSLADLGLPPIVLGFPETAREFAFPVPPNVPLANATLQMDASFVRADGGRTTLILSLDGYPASARPVSVEKGDGSITLPVDGSARTNGVVRFNVDWRTAVARENTCSDTRTPGNLLRIEPTTRLTYRFDAAAVQDLPAAWASLPATPVILVTSNKLSAQAFDTAWRIGVALERAGKHPRIRALPAVGDVVDLQNVSVPAVLKRIPAFASLAEGGKRKIRDIAEVGALIALGAAGPVQPDIVIGDRSIGGAVAQALDALRAQITGEGSDAFTEWRERALDGWSRQLAAGQVRVANVFGRPAIVVAQDAGTDAAALFLLNGPQGGTPSINVAAGDDPRTGDISAVSLKYIGAKPATLDVLSRADWTAGFHISALAAEGKLPSALVIDVAAAPGAARSAPVASVFLNDVLLAARELDASGRRERIVAPIPRHVLSAQNTMRVSFVRQPASDRCRESPEAYPVSVLASSHILLDKAQPGADFSGLITRFAHGAHLLVPAAYLQDAVNTLPRVIAVAASTGMPPARTHFDAVGDDGPQRVKGPFLAMDVPLKDVDSEVKVEAGRLYLAQGAERPLMDVGARTGIVEVVKQGSGVGALYRTVGREGPALERPFQLSQGNVAVIASTGVRAEINTWDPTGQAIVGESRAALPAGRHLWALWTLVLTFLAGVAGYGWWSWRRRLAAVKS